MMGVSVDPVTLIVAILGGGGALATIGALFRVRPDVARVTVSAAEGAVIVQTGVIASLREENARLLEQRNAARDECDQKVREARAECDYLRKQLDAVEERQRYRRNDDRRRNDDQ